MKGWDPEGHVGPKKPLPDSVQILEPVPDKIVAEPTSEQREAAAVPVVAAPQQQEYDAPQQPVDYQSQPEGYSEQPVF
jgi:hypothetical protein